MAIPKLIRDHKKVFNVAKGAVHKAAPLNVMQSNDSKLPWLIHGSNSNGMLELSGAINDKGALAYLNATASNNGQSITYNLLGGRTSVLNRQTGQRRVIESSRSFKEVVGGALDQGVDVPWWAKKNRKPARTNNSTYNIENIVPDYSNPLPENVQQALDRANPRISNPQVSNYARNNPQYRPTNNNPNSSVFNMSRPSADTPGGQSTSIDTSNKGWGPRRNKADVLTSDEHDTLQSLLDEIESGYKSGNLTEQQYYDQIEEVQNMYSDIESQYWANENKKYDPRSPEGRRRKLDDRVEDIEKRYANGDLSDDEYINELQEAHERYGSNNPVDTSNTIAKTEEELKKEQAQKIYDDFMNGNSDPIPEETKARMKYSNNLSGGDDTVTLDNADTTKLDESVNNIQQRLKQEADNRIYDTDEYKRLEEEIIENFNTDKITQDEMNAQLEELDKRYKPLTQEELQDYINDASDPDVRPEDNPFHIDVNSRQSTIEKHFSGEGYEGNIKNGFVQDITIGKDNYTIKHRADSGVIDIFDSAGNAVADEAIVKDVNAKVYDEVKNYYNNLTDEEWDTVINNAADYIGFDKNKVSETLGKADADMLNMNDAIAYRQSVLKEQRGVIEKDLETTKGKKKRKKMSDQRNALDIKWNEAERIRQNNTHKLEANTRRKQARDKFNKTLGLDAFEAGSDEFKQAYEALKGTEEFAAATEVFKKDLKNINKVKKSAIANTNKTIDATIKGLSGKGLTLSNAITIGSAAIGAVNKYKESRAEGKGMVSSAARAGATAIASEVMGVPATFAVMGARALGNAAVEAGDMLYKESRRMNSMSNFTPLGGVNFQDSQELATMRQSGMELAKMSQYNLEQTLMGAEAKHLHR